MTYNVFDVDWPRVIVPVRIAMEIFYSRFTVHLLGRDKLIGHSPGSLGSPLQLV